MQLLLCITRTNRNINFEKHFSETTRCTDVNKLWMLPFGQKEGDALLWCNVSWWYNAMLRSNTKMWCFVMENRNVWFLSPWTFKTTEYLVRGIVVLINYRVVFSNLTPQQRSRDLKCYIPFLCLFCQRIDVCSYFAMAQNTSKKKRVSFMKACFWSCYLLGLHDSSRASGVCTRDLCYLHMFVSKACDITKCFGRMIIAWRPKVH